MIQNNDKAYLVSENINEILFMLGVEDSYDPRLFGHVISQNSLKTLETLETLSYLISLTSSSPLNTPLNPPFNPSTPKGGIVLGENTNCCTKCLRFYYVDLNSSPHRCGKEPGEGPPADQPWSQPNANAGAYPKLRANAGANANACASVDAPY